MTRTCLCVQLGRRRHLREPARVTVRHEGRERTSGNRVRQVAYVVRRADKPTALGRILDEFALRGINLTKIESRPTKQALGEYCIFLDCAGHITEARVGAAGLRQRISGERELNGATRKQKQGGKKRR